MIRLYNFKLSYKTHYLKKNISVQECLYSRDKFIIFQSKIIVFCINRH